MNPLFWLAEIGDSFDNLMYSFVVLGNTLIRDTNGATMGNSIFKVYDTIDSIFTFVDEERVKCLSPVRIETTRKFCSRRQFALVKQRVFTSINR